MSYSFYKFMIKKHCPIKFYENMNPQQKLAFNIKSSRKNKDFIMAAFPNTSDKNEILEFFKLENADEETLKTFEKCYKEYLHEKNLRKKPKKVKEVDLDD